MFCSFIADAKTRKTKSIEILPQSMKSLSYKL